MTDDAEHESDQELDRGSVRERNADRSLRRAATRREPDAAADIDTRWLLRYSSAASLAITQLPELTTERLVLRVPTPDDAAIVAAYARDNRAHNAPWDPRRSDEHYTVEGARQELAAGLEQVVAGTGLPFALFRRDEPRGPLLGRCRFSNIVHGAFQAAHLGYGLDHRAVGCGFMTEALRAAIGHCFGRLDLHRIMASYLPGNVRSADLLRRLGFVVEGYARDYLLIAGRWQDHVLTSLTNDRWRGDG